MTLNVTNSNEKEVSTRYCDRGRSFKSDGGRSEVRERRGRTATPGMSKVNSGWSEDEVFINEEWWKNVLMII